jgi:hypothetical protein
MKHLLLQEITDWDTPNHIYIVTEKKDRLIGYIKKGTSEPEMFKRPVRFETRLRKFKQLATL